MFECVDCGHRGLEFDVAAGNPHSGSLSYQAKCPKCGSQKVNVLPGPKEDELKLSFKKGMPCS